MVRKDCKHYDPPSGWDGADGCLLRNDWFTPCENCERYESKNKQSNADYVRSMTDEELAEWYWWMLHYVQGYTDSRVALREWLKQDYTTFVAQEYKKDLIDRLNREGISP